jgi:hypothetical protein
MAMLEFDHPSTLWLRKIITRAEQLRAHHQEELSIVFHEEGFEMDAG